MLLGIGCCLDDTYMTNTEVLWIHASHLLLVYCYLAAHQSHIGKYGTLQVASCQPIMSKQNVNFGIVGDQKVS